MNEIECDLFKERHIEMKSNRFDVCVCQARNNNMHLYMQTNKGKHNIQVISCKQINHFEKKEKQL